MTTIELVNLNFPAPGFDKFISAWIIQDSEKLFVLDPGPTNSLPILYQALAGRTPDYILLTHIHVDHAGGIGELSKKFPNAKIVAHEKAHRHLVDPSKLIEGSIKTLGALMDLYGSIEPIKEESIAKNFGCVKIIETPGHAPHHISFIFKDYIFCGEALGVTYPLSGEGIYLRPATPPVFNLETYLRSIDLLEGVYEDQTLCFGHFGLSKKEANYFQCAREQIRIWLQVVKSVDKTEELSNEKLNEIIALLTKEDPHFANFENLPSDIQERERIFIKNSINGLR